MVENNILPAYVRKNLNKEARYVPSNSPKTKIRWEVCLAQMLKM